MLISTHTPLARRDCAYLHMCHLLVISTHTPLARRDTDSDEQNIVIAISTHTPLARRDKVAVIKGVPVLKFLLTRLLRGVTAMMANQGYKGSISTHTPLARRDLLHRLSPHSDIHFYSHASCEAWPGDYDLILPIAYFYSHASCEAWHIPQLQLSCAAAISTHTPLARRDSETLHPRGMPVLFLLTRLLRGVTFQMTLYGVMTVISTHTPLARRDNTLYSPFVRFSISTHTPLARRDHLMKSSIQTQNISTHTPLARRDGLPFVPYVGYVAISTHTPLARRDKITYTLTYTN